MANLGVAVDENGNYCGKSVETGQFIDIGPDVMGYCGPNCQHCVGFPVYVIQDGVWVCAADWDYKES